MMRTLKMEKLECRFNRDGYCYALCCFSKEQCGARDEDGNPRYVSNEIYFKLKKLKENGEA